LNKNNEYFFWAGTSNADGTDVYWVKPDIA